MAAMASRTWQISQATCTAETSTTEEISCHDTQAQAWMRAPMNWMISTIPGSFHAPPPESGGEKQQAV
jgi:hypothetical protein